MLIKTADDQAALLLDLEKRAAGTDVGARKAKEELRMRKAGIRGEKDSAYLIDFDFAQSPNWAVIHDLRFEHAGRTAQIDHVLINRWMDVYVLETKHFHSGMKITEEGEFLRWNDFRKKFEGMASPLEQNERHIKVLKDVMATISLPTRLGLAIQPAFQQLVLASPKARIDRPKKFDASRVIKADLLKKTIDRDFEKENPLIGILRTAAKLVSAETVEYVARQLAACHRPLRANEAQKVPTLSPVLPKPEAINSPEKERVEPALKPIVGTVDTSQGKAVSCKSCGKSEGSVLYGKYGYYLKCGACDTNTAIRFSCQPGHRPRLRKDGDNFHRECAQCGSSDLVHRNVAGAGQ
ncbi:MAG: NERD domain-containing protein [Stenotrophomonas sp.]